MGNATTVKNAITTKAVGGSRYPVWSYFDEKELELDKNIHFAPDMRVILYNCSKSLILRSEKKEIIGEFCVPVSSIIKFYKKPQYFNVISHEGTLQG